MLLNVFRDKLIDIKQRRSFYFLALRGVMLNGGPGGPKDLGNRSTHNCIRPCVLANKTTQRRLTGQLMKNMKKKK